MPRLLCIFILNVSFVLLVFAAYAESGNTSEKPTKQLSEGNSVKKPQNSVGNRRPPHPLPPAAMPGILNNFESSSAMHNRKKFLSDMRYLKKQFGTVEKPLTRKRRSPSHPKPIPQMITASGNRRRRDLRRLRRDLGYDSPTLDEMVQSSYIMAKQPEFRSPKYSGNSPSYRARTPDLAQLFQGLDILQQLSYLTNAREAASQVPEQRHPIHAPPSRFAPQPKLFSDEDIPLHRPLRNEAMIRYSEHSPKEPILLIPEKRRVRPYVGAGLSKVPGFKRSAFREASRGSHGRRYGLSQDDVSSLAAILGAEKDPLENRIRRAAM